MFRQAVKRPFFLACLLLSGWSSPPAAGQEAISSAFSIKPSEVSIPDGAELGKYRRIIHPFQNWELRCDENLKTRKKICNVTQTILDADGQFAFSWSLAASEGGKPLMILRTRYEPGASRYLHLELSGRNEPVTIPAEGCDGKVCVAYLPVGPLLREQIAKEADVRISYDDAAGTAIVLDAPLAGLSAALAAIK
ncbi:invasion associated locus B family protein [Phyllobacterium endophyticum]|uniref:invasion associated locus B family protein n=1 Tax=Phyllobacterium endophyticum TaxID=1149773 RepID=UPI0011CAB1A5|nr:invasion associated locus B family protein [Phyllobacterium endophyticum]TXR47545.1 invasion associated locus B family protein [Phyllobacterium endophyticum]